MKTLTAIQFDALSAADVIGELHHTVGTGTRLALERRGMVERRGTEFRYYITAAGRAAVAGLTDVTASSAGIKPEVAARLARLAAR